MCPPSYSIKTHCPSDHSFFLFVILSVELDCAICAAARAGPLYIKHPFVPALTAGAAAHGTAPAPVPCARSSYGECTALASSASSCGFPLSQPPYFPAATPHRVFCSPPLPSERGCWPPPQGYVFLPCSYDLGPVWASAGSHKASPPLSPARTSVQCSLRWTGRTACGATPPHPVHSYLAPARPTPSPAPPSMQILQASEFITNAWSPSFGLPVFMRFLFSILAVASWRPFLQ